MNNCTPFVQIFLLNHLLAGDLAWMGRFTGQSIEGLTIGIDIYADFYELHKARVKQDQEILIWVNQLDEDWLNQPFIFTSKVDNKKRELPTWALITHMFNHQTYHRGQVTTLIKQLGIDPGVTDIPFMPEFKN